jgi:hypothetical protein
MYEHPCSVHIRHSLARGCVQEGCQAALRYIQSAFRMHMWISGGECPMLIGSAVILGSKILLTSCVLWMGLTSNCSMDPHTRRLGPLRLRRSDTPVHDQGAVNVAFLSILWHETCHRSRFLAWGAHHQDPPTIRYHERDFRHALPYDLT